MSRIKSRRACETGAIFALLAAAAAQAQPCGDWIRGPGQGLAGLDTTASASLVWSPGGSEPPVLVVGGFFGYAGDTEAPYIAAWDGSRWMNFAPGLADGNSIQAISVYQGDLVIGGSITTAHGQPINRIARWDGTQWHPFGQGMNDVVYSLIEHQGDLYAAGAFTTAGGAPANRVARWDGSTWHALGSGLNDTVYAMRLWEGEFHAAGTFTASGTTQVLRLARWDGMNWHEVGTGLNGLAYALTEHDGDLIIGGSFTQFGQPGGSNITARRILRWDGQSGTEPGGGFNSTVRQLTVWQGDLVAGGPFSTSGPTGYSGIARFDAQANEWQRLGSAFSQSLNANSVRTMIEFDGELILGGAFGRMGGTGSRFIARWNGEAWRPLGEVPDDLVYDFAEAPEGGMYVAGRFGFYAENPPIARIDGQWHRVGEASGGLTGRGRHLAHYQNDLVLGGGFSSPSGATNVLARWNGQEWSPFAPGFESLMGSGILASIHYQGSFYLGGDFTTTAPCWRFGRWDGSQWHCINTADEILSLAVFEGDLYAGGAFTNIDGVPARFFAYWNGVQWQPLANNQTNGYIHSMVVYDGRLILGGSYNRIGETTGLNRMAAWDGQSFSPLGAGMNDAVESVVLYRGDLVAAGAFTTAGGAPANRIARWNGQTWSPMGDGIPGGRVFGLRVFGERLEVGGSFAQAGGRYSQNWATWSEEAPTIDTHPAAVSACRGDEVSFSIAASGPGTLSYRWRRNGVDLSDGPTPAGATIVGATTAQLRIVNLSHLDSGVYDCIVTSPCGSSTSAGALLEMCYANCDCSNTPPILNVDDFTCFINEFAAAQQLTHQQQLTHYANCDQSTTGPILTVDDFTCFINRFASGCP